MMAAGVAVVQFVPGLDLVRHALGLWLILLGGLLAGWLTQVGGTQLAFSAGGATGLVMSALAAREITLGRTAVPSPR